MAPQKVLKLPEEAIQGKTTDAAGQPGEAREDVCDLRDCWSARVKAREAVDDSSSLDRFIYCRWITCPSSFPALPLREDCFLLEWWALLR
jgi:hypothetical protein